jgi:hypothetical protein
MTWPTFVSFCTTDNGYAEEAAQLIETLDRFGLPHHVAPIGPSTGWARDCNRKPEFLRSCLDRFGPVVWLDADARVIREPILLRGIDADFAAHWRHGEELLSGTMYFGPGAEMLLDVWSIRCAAMPGAMDQRNLADAIATVPDVRMVRLPVEYTSIFDGADLPAEPVILHTQASRRLKREPK